MTAYVVKNWAKEILRWDLASVIFMQENLETFTAKLPELDFDRSKVLTGFHVFDGQVHLFVVEGLHEKTMRDFADFINANLSDGIDTTHSRFLWDSSLHFSRRLYGGLGASLFRLHLVRSLSFLAAESYVKMAREYPPEVAFTVHQLHQMAFCARTPRDLLKNRLYPSVPHLRTLWTCLGEIYNRPEWGNECSTSSWCHALRPIMRSWDQDRRN